MPRPPRLLSFVLLLASGLIAARAAAQRCAGEVCMWAEARRGETALFVRNNRTDRVRVTVWFPVLRGLRPDRDVPRSVSLGPGAEVQALKLVPAPGQMGGFVYRFDWQPDPAVACAGREVCVTSARTSGALRFLAENRQDVPMTVYLTINNRTDSALVRPNDRAEVARLLPDAPMPAWRYRWRYGVPGAVADTAFVYALPFGGDLTGRVARGPRPGAGLQSEHVVAFDLPEHTPVVAARAGSVVAVTDTLEGRLPDSLRFVPGAPGLPPGVVEVAPGLYERRTGVRVNYVFVLHDDGTFGRYLGLARGSAAAAKGARVRQGQALGRTTGEPLAFSVVRDLQRHQTLPMRFQVAGTVRALITGDELRAAQ